MEAVSGSDYEVKCRVCSSTIPCFIEACECGLVHESCLDKERLHSADHQRCDHCDEEYELRECINEQRQTPIDRIRKDIFVALVIIHTIVFIIFTLLQMSPSAEKIRSLGLFTSIRHDVIVNAAASYILFVCLCAFVLLLVAAIVVIVFLVSIEDGRGILSHHADHDDAWDLFLLLLFFSAFSAFIMLICMCLSLKQRASMHRRQYEVERWRVCERIDKSV